jgi:ferritin-like metal-binding protein YciE
MKKRVFQIRAIGYWRPEHPNRKDARVTETQIKDQLVEYIKDAHAMETNILQMLATQIATTPDDHIKVELEHHQEETERQRERLEECLAGYGESASAVKDLTAGSSAMVKGLIDTVRPDKPVRNARDAYTTESLEIASYELLERWADRAGDSATAEVARLNRAEEEAMREKVVANWDRYIEMELEDSEEA